LATLVDSDLSRNGITWDSAQTLGETVQAIFGPVIVDVKPRDRESDIAIPISLIGKCLSRNYVLDVKLVSNFRDHLKYDQETSKIKVYEHLIYLYSQKHHGPPHLPYLIITEAIHTSSCSPNLRIRKQ
jgi:hypothetical protein